MRVVVFGGTGRTGRHVIDAALADGHEVIALVRDPSKLHRQDPGLHPMKGDLSDRPTVLGALADADGVVSAAGHVAGTRPDLLQGLAEALVEGLVDRPVRVVTLLGGAVNWPGDLPPSFGRRFMQGAMRLFAGAMLRDAQAHADRLRASRLTFVIARPPRLTDAPATGRVISAQYVEMGLSATLSRADLGRFLVDQLKDETFLGAAPMLHNVAP